MSHDRLCLIEEKKNRHKGGYEELGCSFPTANQGTISPRQTLKIALCWPHPCQPHLSEDCMNRLLQLSVPTGNWPAALVTQTGGSVLCVGGAEQELDPRAGLVKTATEAHISIGPSGLWALPEILHIQGEAGGIW